MAADQVSDTLEGELHTFEEGLRDTEHARSLTDNSDRRLPLLIRRLSILQFQDRLHTFLHLSNNQYMPSAYAQFRDTPLTHIAYTFAAAGKMGALAVLLSRHPNSIAPHLLNILDAVPDTLDVAEYQTILATIEHIINTSGNEIQIERSADWAEDNDILQYIRAASSGTIADLPETEYTNRFLQQQDSKTIVPTWLQVAEWIAQKAVAIDKNSGQLVKSVALLLLGIQVLSKHLTTGSSKASGLEDVLLAAQQLALVLSAAEMTVRDIQNDDEEDEDAEDEDDGRRLYSRNVTPKAAAGDNEMLLEQQRAFIMDASLEEFIQLGQQERLEILLNVLETATPLSRGYQQMLLDFTLLATPREQDEEYDNLSSLLVDALIQRVENNMSQVVALLSLEATEPVALSAPELVCSVALQCVDACTDMEADDWLQQLIQAARQAACLASSSDLEDKVEQVAQRVAAAHALTEQGLQCTPGQLAPMDSLQAQEVITSLLVNIQNSREARHDEDAWLDLWQTVQFVQQHGFKEGVLSKEVVHTEVCRAMLKSGQCELAAEHVLPGLSAQDAERVVLSTAEDIFTTSKNLVTPSAERIIRDCLGLLLPPTSHQNQNSQNTGSSSNTAAQALLQALDTAIELQSLGVQSLDVSRLLPSGKQDGKGDDLVYDRETVLEDILASQPELAADIHTMTALADALGVSGDRGGLLMRAVEAGLASGQISAAQRSALALVQMHSNNYYTSRNNDSGDSSSRGAGENKELEEQEEEEAQKEGRGLGTDIQKKRQEMSRVWELLARVALDSRCHDTEVKRQLLGYAALNAPPSEALKLLKSWREQDEMIGQKAGASSGSGGLRFWPSSLSNEDDDHGDEVCRMALHQYFKKATMAENATITSLSTTLAVGSLLSQGVHGLLFWDQLLDHHTPQLSYNALKEALELGLACAAIISLQHGASSNDGDDDVSKGNILSKYLTMPVERLEEMATENAPDSSDNEQAMEAREAVLKYRKMLDDAADAFKLETLLAKNNAARTSTTSATTEQLPHSGRKNLITASSASRRDAVFDLVTSAANQLDVSQGQSTLEDALRLGSRHDIASHVLHLHYLKCFLTSQWGRAQQYDQNSIIIEGSLQVVLDHVPEATVDMLATDILPLYITKTPSAEHLMQVLSMIVSCTHALAGKHDNNNDSDSMVSSSWNTLGSITSGLQAAMNNVGTAPSFQASLFLSPLIPNIMSAVSAQTSTHNQINLAIPNEKVLLQEIWQICTLQPAAAAASVKETDALASWVEQLHTLSSQLAQLSATMQQQEADAYPITPSQVYTTALCCMILQGTLDTSLIQHYLKGMDLGEIIKTVTWATVDGSTIPLVNMNVHQLPHLDDDAQIQLLGTALTNLRERLENPKGDAAGGLVEKHQQHYEVAMWQLQRECLRLKASKFIQDSCGAKLNENEAENVQETLAILAEFGLEFSTAIAIDNDDEGRESDTRGELAFERCLKELLTTGCSMRIIFFIATALLSMQDDDSKSGDSNKKQMVARIGKTVASATKEALSAIASTPETGASTNSGRVAVAMSIGDAIQNLYGILRSLDCDNNESDGDDDVVKEINKLRGNVWKLLRQHAACQGGDALDAASAEAHLQVVEMLGMLGCSMWQGWSAPTAATATGGRNSARRTSTEKKNVPEAIVVDDAGRDEEVENSTTIAAAVPPPPVVFSSQDMEVRGNAPTEENEEEDYFNNQQLTAAKELEEEEEVEDAVKEDEDNAYDEDEPLPSVEYSHAEAVLFARIVAALSSSGWSGAARQASITASDLASQETTQSAVLKLIDAADTVDKLRAIVTVLSDILDTSTTASNNNQDQGEISPLHSCWFACFSSLLHHGDMSTVVHIIDCHPLCLTKEEVDGIISRGETSHGVAAAVSLWAVSHLGRRYQSSTTTTTMKIPVPMWDQLKQSVLHGPTTGACDLPGMQLALIAALLTDQLCELILMTAGSNSHSNNNNVVCRYVLPCILNEPPPSSSSSSSSVQPSFSPWSQFWSEDIKISPRSAVAGLLASQLVMRRAYTVAAAVAMEHSCLHPMLRMIDSGMRSVRDLLKACSKVRFGDGGDDEGQCNGVVVVPEGSGLEVPYMLASVISKVPEASAAALDELMSILK